MMEKSKAPFRRSLLRSSVAAILFLCLAFTCVSLWLFGPAPFLRDVSEPISITKVVYRGGSDGHWMGVTFKDTRGVERSVQCILYIPETDRILALGENKVRVGGREERAFLGLLQRWYRQDAEAPVL